MKPQMTWGEFKKSLEDSGVKDSEKIWYIDVHMPTELAPVIWKEYLGFAVTAES